MPESRKYLQSTELTTVNATAMSSSSTLEDNVEKIIEKEDLKDQGTRERHQSVVEALAYQPKPAGKWRVFGEYFSEWRHLKMLIGTALTWFLVDISFYGINLNQSVLLQEIGFARGSTEYHTLILAAVGNLIITVAGYLPGYFLTIGFIELLGRKWIQIQGFIITALMFGVIAGDYVGAGTGGKFVCFVFAQLFFNFGPNATTFIVPAECFPSRVRGLAHGLSAATGKLGAILSGVLFNYLANDVLNVPKVLWIFFAVNLAGAVVTLIFVPETKGIDADAVDYEECQARVAKNAHL